MPNDVLDAEKTVEEAVSPEPHVLVERVEAKEESAEQKVTEQSADQDVREKSVEQEVRAEHKLWFEPPLLQTDGEGLLGSAFSSRALLSDLSLVMRLEASVFAGLGLFLFFLPEANSMTRTVGYIAFLICLMVLAL